MPNSRLQRIAISPSQLQNQQILLTSQQQHYLSRVLRLGKGENFIAMNGEGEWWLAKLEGEQAEIIESINIKTELPIVVNLIVALPKGNRFDEVVRQTTALGVTSIIPVISDRTLLKPSPQKLERWRRIAVEAAEQSERQTVPTILDPIPFTTALSLSQTETSNNPEFPIPHSPFPIPQEKYICVPRDTHPHLLNSLLSTPHSAIAIATGPEGGWMPTEVELAYSASFQPVSLGCRILTAVLAPTVALSMLAAALEMGNIKKET